MTDQQLQSLRNLGCEFEEAAALLRSQAAEIESLREQLASAQECNRELVPRAKKHDEEQAALRADAERLEWLEHWLFEKRWNGVIGAGSQTDWTMAGNWRHITVKMRGHTFRAAIDAARQS